MSNPEAVVILVRHGRTALNAAGVLRGRLDPPLDDVGQAEAESLAQVLRGFEFSLVVSSPLLRARQTAAPIARARNAVLEIDPALADRDYGEWAGSSVEDVAQRFGSFESAPGIEPAGAFTDRSVAAVLAAARRGGGAPVVAVAHDAVNRAVLGHLVPTLGDPVAVPQRTGCWNRLEGRDGVWSAPVVDALPPAGGASGG